MKKINLNLLILFFFIASIAASANANDLHNLSIRHNKSFISPRADFDSLWVEYDITQEGERGMFIHIKFVTHEMKGIDSDVAVFFEDDKGKRLKDKNQKFYSSGGDVALYFDIKPEYDPAYYNDLKLFMPYSELDLDAGKYDLSMEVKLIYANGDPIQRLTYHDFQYTKPGSTSKTTSSTAPDATFDKIWVDYDATENSQSGMRIHVKFGVTNMKGVDSYLAIYFETQDGEILKTEIKDYRSKEGQVAVYKSLKPNYDASDYADVQLFIPYVALNLGPGKSDLTMDADVIYKNGDLVKHLSYYNFWVKY